MDKREPASQSRTCRPQQRPWIHGLPGGAADRRLTGGHRVSWASAGPIVSVRGRVPVRTAARLCGTGWGGLSSRSRSRPRRRRELHSRACPRSCGHTTSVPGATRPLSPEPRGKLQKHLRRDRGRASTVGSRPRGEACRGRPWAAGAAVTARRPGGRAGDPGAPREGRAPSSRSRPGAAPGPAASRAGASPPSCKDRRLRRAGLSAAPAAPASGRASRRR